jgi:DNA mismatch repair ATPase MutS
LEQCKRDLNTLLPAWLDTWYELEALSSLATFAYLNPGTTFPRVEPGPSPAGLLFHARDLGHPLIPAGQRVGNDFALDELGRVILITGSNMAGKSSFLRALGVNLCLAFAGGPVVAQEMVTRLFRLYTSMRLTDSVTDGYSFFYAEVRRLKALLMELEQGEERPLFFLIDEIFRGTNNQERLLGSRAYVRALAGGHGVGFIATHDLELVKLADENPLIHNYHFRDAVVDGRMVFDYKLHPGPCPTTNALKIMALAGLPV